MAGMQASPPGSQRGVSEGKGKEEARGEEGSEGEKGRKRWRRKRDRKILVEMRAGLGKRKRRRKRRSTARRK